MRQILSWRFVAAVVAVSALVAGALLLQSARSGFGSLDSQSGTTPRRMNVVSLVTGIETSENFAIDNGRVRGAIGVEIQVAGEPRGVQISAGTPGVNQCETLEAYRCAFLADTLGDSIVWFALVPMLEGQQFQFELAPIVDLQDGYALLDNGWEVPYAPVIDRSCAPDVATFAEFLQRYERAFRSVFDLRDGAIVRVSKCVDPSGGTEPPDAPPA